MPPESEESLRPSLRDFMHDTVTGGGLRPIIDLTLGYNVVANGAGGFDFDLAVGGEIPETRPGPDTDRLGDLGRLDIFAGPVEIVT